MIQLKKIEDSERQEMIRFLREELHSQQKIIRGRAVDISQEKGIAAYHGKKIVGLLTYKIAQSECEILSLDSILENQGLGTKLLAQLTEDIAKAGGCRKIKLVITNDNLNAMRFYQKRGFDLSMILRDTITKARAEQSGLPIPFTGDFGIPVRHEIELEKELE